MIAAAIVGVFIMIGYGAGLYFVLKSVVGWTPDDIWRGGLFWLIYFGGFLLVGWFYERKQKSTDSDGGKPDDDGGTDPSSSGDPSEMTAEELEELYNTGE